MTETAFPNVSRIAFLPRWVLVLGLGALGIVSGCAQKLLYTSVPAKQSTETGAFKIQLRPDKEGLNSFIVFELTVINKTADPLEIDWNKTKYLHNGQARGGFLFEGVQPGYVKGATVMTHGISGNSVYRKTIAPTHCVAYVPIKDQQTLRVGEDALSAGPLPTGQNGMRLFIRHRNIETSVVLVVDIKEAPAS